MKNNTQDASASDLRKSIFKWYSVPNTESWQYGGLMIVAVILVGYSIFDIVASLFANGDEFLEHLNWVLIIGAGIVASWYGGIAKIQEEWDAVWYSERDHIDNWQENRLYMTPMWKYIFCVGTLCISWLILGGFALYLLTSIEDVLNESPEKIIIALLVIIAIMVYKKK
jgi:hypothetical protein